PSGEGDTVPSAPTASSFERVSVDCMAFTVSACSRRTIAAGVLAGANTPYQVVIRYPGSPASSAVGTSGNAGRRPALETASARSLPERTCGAEARLVSNAPT